MADNREAECQATFRLLIHDGAVENHRIVPIINSKVYC